MDDYRDMDDSIRAKLEAELANLQRQHVELQKEHQRAIQLWHGKIAEARANPDARIARLKHQNNEMRVFMSAVHRHLSGIARIAGVKPHEKIDRAALNDAVNNAMGHWNRVNDWLAANKIEPYLGTAPGVEAEKVAEPL